MRMRWLFTGAAAAALLAGHAVAMQIDFRDADGQFFDRNVQDLSVGVSTAAKKKRGPIYQFDPPNPYAKKRPRSPDDVYIKKLIVLGDDHSAAPLSYAKWHQILTDPDWWERGTERCGCKVAKDASYAKVGATSLASDNPSLKTEVDQLLLGKKKKKKKEKFKGGKRIATIAYIGHNDIRADDGLSGLEQRWQDAQAQFERLIAAGATSKGRRIWIITNYDYGRAPGLTGLEAGRLSERSRQWRQHIFTYSQPANNTVAIDWFTFSERVFSNPTRFGLSRAQDFFAGTGSGAMLSGRAHELLAILVEYYMSQGWNWSNSLPPGDQTVTALEAAIDAGLDTFAFRKDGALFAFPVGTAEPTFRFGEADAATSGIGLGWRVGADTAVAFVQAGGDAHQRAERDGGTVRSDSSLSLSGVALVQRGEGWTAQTRLLWGREDVVRRNFDAFTGTVTRGGTDGSWLQFSQRFEGERETAAGTLRPWAALDVTRRRIDGYAMSDPYLGTARYGGAAVTDVTGSFGLAFDAAPIALDAEGTTLRLSGQLGYVRDLRADPYEVRVQLGENSRWTERIERPQRSDVFAGFSATLELGEDTALGARYGFAHGVAGTDHAIGVSFTHRF